MKAVITFIGLFLKKSLRVAIDMTPKCNVVTTFSVALLLLAQVSWARDEEISK